MQPVSPTNLATRRPCCPAYRKSVAVAVGEYNAAGCRRAVHLAHVRLRPLPQRRVAGGRQAVLQLHR